MTGVKAARRMGLAVTATIALCAYPISAFGQDNPTGFNIGIGPIVPSGDIADRFDTGFTVPVGVTLNISETVGIQFEYEYARMDGPSASLTPLDVGGTGAITLSTNHQIHGGAVNLVFRTNRSRGVGAYGLVGPGFYHRRVSLTSSQSGRVSICDPWWLVCTSTPVVVSEILGRRSTNDFGINVGGGVTFGHLFVEVRYQYIRGPAFNVPTPHGTTRSGNVRADGHYLPITFGLRF